MKIEFIKPDKVAHTGIKISLFKSGKITFNKGAVEKFEIDPETNVKIGFDAENPSEKAIYLTKTDEGDLLGKKINQSGGKTILSISFALEQLGIDYRNKKYLTRTEFVDIDNTKYLKLLFLEVV
jgi:hypothetical protein